MKFVRKLRGGADLYLGKQTSKGLAGTLENIACHAKACLPFVQLLVTVREDLNIERWIEAHNVHEFITHDKRKYKFRPIHCVTNGYIGIELSQALPKGIEMPVFQIIDTTDAGVLISYLDVLVRPWVVNNTDRAVLNRKRIAALA